MAIPKVEFTRVTGLRAEALGEPGKRTFRIQVDSESSSATMWLEKEQLFQLALAIGHLQASLPEGSGSGGGARFGDEVGPQAHVEFKVGKLVLGHEGNSDRFIIDAHDTESAEDDEDPTVRVWSERDQLTAFAEESLRICAAGRPLCTLCGGPIDPTGHVCPRSNGHALQDLTEL